MFTRITHKFAMLSGIVLLNKFISGFAELDCSHTIKSRRKASVPNEGLRLIKIINKRLGQLLDYEPSERGKIIYIKLNIPTPCPPRGACPWSTGGEPVASFINDKPDQN